MPPNTSGLIPNLGPGSIPYPRGEGDAARRRRLQVEVLNRTRNRTAAIAAQNIAQGIGEAMLASGEVLGLTQRIVAEALAKKQLTGTERRRIHQAAGEAAQRSMLAGYDNRRNRRGTPAYRLQPRNPRNTRLAGGILRRALSDPQQVRADAQGVQFINAQLLDREAAHWRRINFGAGSAAGSRPTQFGVRWGSLVIGALGLVDPPSPRFAIPTGTWLGREFYPRGEGPDPSNRGKRNILTDPPVAGGQDRPGRRQKRAITAGIVASQFMDAGVRRLATELPRGYVGAIERIYTADRIRFEGIAREVRVPIKVFRAPGAGTFRPSRLR